MSLDVSIQFDTAPSPHSEPPPVVPFENEGYYWFLFPLFQQLERETRQMIDLYGDATFKGKDLEALARTIGRARYLTASQPERWNVSTGTMTQPVVQEQYATVSKKRMQAFLDHLEETVERARAVGASVRFTGD